MIFVNDLPESREFGMKFFFFLFYWFSFFLTFVKSSTLTSALAHLCEFIEDCEHTSLLVNILHLLGKEGPKTQHPSKYIRYIYNRIILENSIVRATATTALAKFGVLLEELRPNIVVLLRRCMNDSDDEVRDRSTLYLSLMENDLETAKRHLTNGLFIVAILLFLPILLLS